MVDIPVEEVLRVCHYCLCEDSPSSLITSSCLCSYGVHEQCLENWLNFKKQTKCDDCDFEFDVVAKLKYTFAESIRIWLEYPINRAYFLTQFVLIVFLNVMVTLLIGATSQHIFRLVQNGLNPFSNECWRMGSLTLALMLSMLLFIRCNIIFLESQIFSWYRWWRSRLHYQLRTLHWIKEKLMKMDRP